MVSLRSSGLEAFREGTPPASGDVALTEYYSYEVMVGCLRVPLSDLAVPSVGRGYGRRRIVRSHHPDTDSGADAGVRQ